MDITEKAEGIIRLALSEDLGTEGDITTRAVCSQGAGGKADIICREPCTIAGQSVAAKTFSLAGAGAVYRPLVNDGETAGSQVVIGKVEGPLDAILAGERTALNFLTHMSGIATLTARLVALAAPHGVKLLDTRKTTPGLRVLEKYAVNVGGGVNHRMGLFDGVLIKDNHIVAAGGLEIAVHRVRNSVYGKLEVEVEASNLAEVREAVSAGADIIMLDNMEPAIVKEALALINGAARVEISGGVTPENIASYARLGVESISLGFITHSAPAVDMSLELIDRS